MPAKSKSSKLKPNSKSSKSKLQSKLKSKSKSKRRTKSKRTDDSRDSDDENTFNQVFASYSTPIVIPSYVSAQTQLQNLQNLADYQRVSQQSVKVQQPQIQRETPVQQPVQIQPQVQSQQPMDMKLNFPQVKLGDYKAPPPPAPVSTPIAPPPITAVNQVIAPIIAPVNPIIAPIITPVAAIPIVGPVIANVLPLPDPLPIAPQETKTSGFFLEGPFAMIRMYNEALDKEVYFFSDFHANLGGCESDANLRPLVEFAQFVENVAKQQSPTKIDLFLEANPHDDKKPELEEGYLFSKVVPYFRDQGCLSLDTEDKSKCSKKYPNLRVHYMDLRDNDRKSLLYRLTEIYRVVNLADVILQEEEEVDDALKEIYETPLSDISETINAHYSQLGPFFPVLEEWLNQVLAYAPDSKDDEPITVNVVLNATPKIINASKTYGSHQAEYLRDVMVFGRKRHFVSINDMVARIIQSQRLPIRSMQTQLRHVKLLIEDYFKTKKTDTETETETERENKRNNIFGLFSNILKEAFEILMFVSSVMDLYAVDRYLKPYVRRSIVYMGDSHIGNQIFLLEKLGFVIEGSIPSRYPELTIFKNDFYVLPESNYLLQAVYNNSERTIGYQVKYSNGLIGYLPAGNPIPMRQCLYIRSPALFRPLKEDVRFGGLTHDKPKKGGTAHGKPIRSTHTTNVVVLQQLF